MDKERRNTARRGTIVRAVLDSIIQNPSVLLSAKMLQEWLHVPADAAERILQHLSDSGLMREVRKGVWVRGAIPGSQPLWS